MIENRSSEKASRPRGAKKWPLLAKPGGRSHLGLIPSTLRDGTAWSRLFPTKIQAYEARLDACILVTIKLELLGHLRYVVVTLSWKRLTNLCWTKMAISPRTLREATGGAQSAPVPPSAERSISVRQWAVRWGRLVQPGAQGGWAQPAT